MKSISEEQARKELNKESEKVEEKDLNKVLNKRSKIEDKIRGNDTVDKYIGKVKTMFSLIMDYRNGSYRELPWKTITAVAGALLYVLNPLDLIPDFIPVLGMVDDASVLALCLKLVNDDLENYMRWKNLSSPEEHEENTA